MTLGTALQIKVTAVPQIGCDPVGMGFPISLLAPKKIYT